MPTIQDILTRALRKISSDAPNDTVNGGNVNLALEELNALLDEWSVDDFIIPNRTLENFPMVAGTASYNIGTGATFNTSRPDVVQGMFTRDVNGIDFPVDPMTRQQYNEIPIKTILGKPFNYFYDTQFPTATIYFYPSPDTNYTLYIDSLKPLTQISSLSTALNMPGAYQNLIIYTIAVRLAPDYGFPLQERPELPQIAADLLARLKRRNARTTIASYDSYILPSRGRLPRGWNIYNI